MVVKCGNEPHGRNVPLGVASERAEPTPGTRPIRSGRRIDSGHSHPTFDVPTSGGGSGENVPYVDVGRH